jgi:hypothetical protein
MRKSTLRVPAIAAAALAVVGAAPAGHALSVNPNNPADIQQGAQVTVLVRNHNALDVEVVAVNESGRRFQLGAVHADAGRTFVLPRDLTDGDGQFRLKVYTVDRLVGSHLVKHYLEAVKTQPLSLSAGNEIVLQVQSRLANSFIDRGSSGQN